MSNIWKSTTIIIFLSSTILLCGCIEDDEPGKKDGTTDERHTYDNTISLGPPFSEVRDTNFVIDDDDNIHFIWIDCYHHITPFYNEVKYSKYTIDMEPIITNLTIMSGLMASLGHERELPMLIDSMGNFHTLIDRTADYELDGIHIGQEIFYVKIDPQGQVLVNRSVPRDIRQAFPEGVTDSSARDPDMVIDSKDELHLTWWDWGSVNTGDGEKTLRDIHYTKLDNNGDIIIPDVKLTQDYFNSNERPTILIDKNDIAHIIWCHNPMDGDDRVYYSRLDGRGDKLIILNGPSELAMGYYYSSEIINDNIFAYWAIYESDKVGLTKMDLDGNIISNGQYDMDTSLTNKERSGMVVFGFEGWSCAREDVVLNMTLYNEDGGVVIDNKTVLKILYNPEFDHGPTVFNFQYQKDSTGDIHICYYVNNGANKFQMHHIRFNKNGDIVAPFYIVAPLS